MFDYLWIRLFGASVCVCSLVSESFNGCCCICVGKNASAYYQIDVRSPSERFSYELLCFALNQKCAIAFSLKSKICMMQYSNNNKKVKYHCAHSHINIVRNVQWAIKKREQLYQYIIGAICLFCSSFSSFVYLNKICFMNVSAVEKKHSKQVVSDLNVILLHVQLLINRFSIEFARFTSR